MTELRCFWVHFVGLNAASEGPYAWFNKGQLKNAWANRMKIEMIEMVEMVSSKIFQHIWPKWNDWFAAKSTCTIWWRHSPIVVLIGKPVHIEYVSTFHIYRTLITFTVRTAKTFLQQVVWSPKHLQWEDNLGTWSSNIPHWKGPGGIRKSAGFLGMNSSALLSWCFSLSLEGMVDDLNLSRRLLALRGHVGRKLPASLGGSQCWPWPQWNRLVRESAGIFKDTTCHNVTLHFVWQFNIIHLLEPGSFLWNDI